MPITKNLTVVKNFDGTAYWPAGQTVAVALTCLSTGVEKNAALSVVLLKQVSGVVQEVGPYSAGAQAATKITDACTGLSAYVKESFYDVFSAQNPCCGAATPGNTTPAPPTLTADDTADTLLAAHALGASEIVFSTNGGAFVAYTGTINVGNVARAAGYWQFKIKAAAGRNESAVASSPAFTVAVVVNPTLGTPTITFANITDTAFDVVIGNVANAESFDVEISNGAGFSANLANGNVAASANPRQFHFAGGQPTTVYYARAKAKGTGYTDGAWGTGQVTTAFDTVLTFVASTTGAAENAKFGMAGTVAAINNLQKFYFNKITTTLTGTPSSMTISLGGGAAEFLDDFPSDYLGRTFRYEDSTGASHTGVITNGNVNF